MLLSITSLKHKNQPSALFHAFQATEKKHMVNLLLEKQGHSLIMNTDIMLNTYKTLHNLGASLPSSAKTIKIE